MAQAAQGNSAKPVTLETATATQLLEEAANRTVPQRFKAISDGLVSRVDKLRNALPDSMKDQAERLIQRAVLTLNRKAGDYANVSAESFIRCVLEAAELGLAIDGRLAHAVVFNNCKKVDGKEVWVNEVQLMIDYKGVIAVCKRSGLIEDIYADIVRTKDEFDIYRENAVMHMRHRPALDNSPVVGAYAIVTFPGGRWRYEWMNLAEINNVRTRSKSYNSKKGPAGPWHTDPGEMQKKTVLRRLLKPILDDPAIAGVLTDSDYEEGEVPNREASDFKPRDLQSILAAKAQQLQVQPEPPQLPPDVHVDPDEDPDQPGAAKKEEPAKEPAKEVVKEPTEPAKETPPAAAVPPEEKAAEEKPKPAQTKKRPPPADSTDAIV